MVQLLKLETATTVCSKIIYKIMIKNAKIPTLLKYIKLKGKIHILITLLRFGVMCYIALHKSAILMLHLISKLLHFRMTQLLNFRICLFLLTIYIYSKLAQ